MTDRFDFTTAIEEDIVRLARTLVGMRLGEIPGALFRGRSPVRGKGEVGLAIETYFEMPANSRASADFTGAGIELKAVPLKRSGRGMRAKERTVLGMIDYGAIVEEEWETAKVRGKLDILFVFYEHIIGAPKETYPILGVALWRPRSEAPILRRDWETVRDKVRAGLAHELSESDGRLMGPCTKAADSSRRVAQPVTTFEPVAKPRAFALKPAFTYALYQRSKGSAREMDSLMEALGVSDVEDFEQAILERFQRFEGRQLGDVARELGVHPGSSKNYAAGVIRLALGARTTKDSIKEFVEMGITVRMTRVSPARSPYEAMSFPAFRYLDLVEEEWENSTLLDQLDGLFIFPLEGSVRETPSQRCVVRSPVLWRPTTEELTVVKREWTRYRDLVRSGHAADLPPASETTIIHVRPHARDARDMDEAPGAGAVVKKSFWLNRRYIQDLLTRPPH